MIPLKVPKFVITRKVFWRSKTGKWVVVAGPFPQMMPRTETRDTPDKASKLLVDGIYARPATQRDDQYAKVSTKDVIALDGANEFGPVSP